MRSAPAGDPRARLLRWLAQRDRSEAEIRDRLARWGTEQAFIEELIVEFADRGLVNDQALAERIVDWHCRRDPLGPRRLRMKLRQRGIASDLARASAAAVEDPDRQREMLADLLAKRLTVLESLPRQAAARRMNDYLERRGFDRALIGEITHALLTGEAQREGSD